MHFLLRKAFLVYPFPSSCFQCNLSHCLICFVFPDYLPRRLGRVYLKPFTLDWDLLGSFMRLWVLHPPPQLTHALLAHSTAFPHSDQALTWLHKMNLPSNWLHSPRPKHVGKSTLSFLAVTLSAIKHGGMEVPGPLWQAQILYIDIYHWLFYEWSEMNLFHKQLTFKNVLGKDVQGRADFELFPLLVSLDICRICLP